MKKLILAIILLLSINSFSDEDDITGNTWKKEHPQVETQKPNTPPKSNYTNEERIVSAQERQARAQEELAEDSHVNSLIMRGGIVIGVIITIIVIAK